MARTSKGYWLALVLVATFVLSLVPLPPVTIAQTPQKGPPLDKVTLEVRMYQEKGIKDVAAGQLDAFLWMPPGYWYKMLTPEERAALKLIRVTSTFWSLVFNPVCTDQDGVPGSKSGLFIDKDNNPHFNPFALREFRYAMNWLISRKYIIDETLHGYGEPMFSCIMPTEPAIDQVRSVYAELGLTAEGDYDYGFDMAMSALTEANQSLKSIGYMIVKVPDSSSPAGYWWYFTNETGSVYEPVTIKMLIRVEDERRLEGHLVADLLNKLGIQVERIEADRWTCIYTCYYTDPADYGWHIYTEGWISMSEFKYVEYTIAQMYAPWFGNMPGWGDPTAWNYKNDTIDELSKKICFMNITGPEEYWDTVRTLIRMGIQESVRIFIATNDAYAPFRVDWVTSLAYGRVSGPFNVWAFRTMDTPTHELRAAQFSARGVLFMSAWNPMFGFFDMYSHVIWNALHDMVAAPDPQEGEPIPMRATWKIEHNVPIPDDAIMYDSKADQWKSATDLGISGTTVKSKITFNYKLSRWHYSVLGHDVSMSVYEIVGSFAMVKEWASYDGDDDLYYDPIIDILNTEALEPYKAFRIVNDTAIEVYVDYHNLVDDNITAYYYSLWTSLPWEVLHAMEELMIRPSDFGVSTQYWWHPYFGWEWFNMISSSHVVDLKAAAEGLLNEGHTPVWLNGLGWSPDPSSRYSALISWIDSYGHVAVSNGPFYMEEYNPSQMYCVLKAFRDDTYPFTTDYWQKQLRLQVLEIRSLEAPDLVVVGEEIPITAKVYLVEKYPEASEVVATPNEAPIVTVSLLNASGITVYSGSASYDESIGAFTFTIPSNVTKALPSGVYTVEVKAYQVVGGYPAISSTTIVVTSRILPITIDIIGEGQVLIGGVSITPGTTLKYPEGSIVVAKAVPAEGYNFSHWLLDGNFLSSEEEVTVAVDAAHTLTAVFIPIAPAPPELPSPPYFTGTEYGIIGGGAAAAAAIIGVSLFLTMRRREEEAVS